MEFLPPPSPILSLSLSLYYYCLITVSLVCETEAHPTLILSFPYYSY